MRSPGNFPVRTPAQEARRMFLDRRVKALEAEVRKLVARSTWWRRLLCLLLTHRPWRTGLGGRSPAGDLYALLVCWRCGRRWAERGQEVGP